MIRVPPFFLGTALLFWGWRTDLLLAGALGALVLESAQLIKSRWDFTDTEFNRLWDVCTLIFIGVAFILRFSDDLTRAPYKFFQWFPLIFFLMALGHVYSARPFVPLKSFSWFLRRKGAEGGDRQIAFGWIYYAICIIASGATNLQDHWYYLGVAALAGAALWVNRPRRLSVVGWTGVFFLAVITGYVVQGKMQNLQNYLEAKASELLIHFSRREFDSRQSRTSIGQIGSIKQSSRIVMKVRPEVGPVPARLRQATYVGYSNGLWRGSRRGFEPLPIEADITSWTLMPSTNAHSSIRIIERLNPRRSLLSLPLGTARLRNLLSTAVETNSLAVVRAVENPGLASYSAEFERSRAPDPPPSRRGRDTEVDQPEQAAIAAIAGGLDAGGASARRKIELVENFFAQGGFRYTTYQEASLESGSGTPLAQFLLDTRAGHCEYFATATVLLLRQLGVPARYATGYAVQETSSDGNEYVIRDRHAHAWALAYLDDTWIEVDTTPADWAQIEREAASAGWQKLKEWWQNLVFGFLEWRWLGEAGLFRRAAPWLIAGMVAFLAWRIFGRRMQRQGVSGGGPEIWPGADSEFYLLEKKLQRAGLVRQTSETSAHWAARVQSESHPVSETLPHIVTLHYKYRFDPNGIAEAEREELRRLVRTCLAQLQNL